jgi:hypothetical protein
MIPRLAVALVWLYQGLWCKLLGGCPGHRAIVDAVPWLGERGGPRPFPAVGRHRGRKAVR